MSLSMTGRSRFERNYSWGSPAAVDWWACCSIEGGWLTWWGNESRICFASPPCLQRGTS